MGGQRTRTRDGSIEWLACDDRAVCREVVLGITGKDGFWASLAVCLCLSSISSFSFSLSLFARLSPETV